MGDAEGFGLRWRANAEFPLFSSVDAGPEWTPDINVKLKNSPAPKADFEQEFPRLAIGANLLRIKANEHCIIDVEGDDTITVYQRHSKELPIEFFSFGVALICAQRGLLPIHGCCIEINGKAWLLFGESGNGKSSAAATLIGMGAQLISDDLSIFCLDKTGSPVAFPGRQGIRLLPALDHLLQDQRGEKEPVAESRGKMRYFPPQVSGLDPLPLAGIAYMDVTGDREVIQTEFVSPLLNHHIFIRPMLRQLKSDQQRYAMIRAIAENCQCLRIKGLADRNSTNFAERLLAGIIQGPTQ